jgi:pyridoxamine 5'-phosphate oxidase
MMHDLELNPDPLKQIEIWHQEAQSTEDDPDAMALATATKEGKPSVRMVLFKGVSAGGILIYTNYDSRKALEMSENPNVAVVMYWPRCYRQIRIEGQVEKITDIESDEYFQSRPRGSKIGAWASQQSREIPDRAHLEGLYIEFENQYVKDDIPRPEYWGGFRLIPNDIEFWQGRENRLHDRYCYRKQGNDWKRFRLAP